MQPDTLFTAIAALAVAAMVIQFLITWRRHQKDYREQLEPDLTAHGLTFESARWPGFFQVGPFPKFEAEAGRPASRTFGFRGEFDEYRVVTCTDADRRRHEVWALIEFELFRPRRVRWRAENPQDLPASARAMLEA